MFWQGILVALVTGAIWCGVGVAYSRAAEKKEGFHLFLLLSALCFLLTSWGAERPGAAPLPELLTVAALMIPAGLLSQFGFLALCGAMRRGATASAGGLRSRPCSARLRPESCCSGKPRRPGGSPAWRFCSAASCRSAGPPAQSARPGGRTGSFCCSRFSPFCCSARSRR